MAEPAARCIHDSVLTHLANTPRTEAPLVALTPSTVHKSPAENKDDLHRNQRDLLAHAAVMCTSWACCRFHSQLAALTEGATRGVAKETL